MERAETKMIEIKTAIKLAKLVVEKYSQTSSQPGFIITQNGQKIKVRFTELVEALEELSEKDLAIVCRCKDCENFYKSPAKKSGNCFPPEYDRQRCGNDFCSKQYIERSEKRRNIDEAVRKLSSKKRAGNGS